MAIHQDANLVVTGCCEGEIKIWDLATKSLINTNNKIQLNNDKEKKRIENLSFSHDAKKIIAASFNG
jgi:hypothetical protein